MTRQLALAKFLKESGDNLTINEIKFIKDALTKKASYPPAFYIILHIASVIQLI